jgi:zinc/manganese transport system substrate-binding protein
VWVVASILAVCSGSLAGCGSQNATASTAAGRLPVVAAENFWGSIASQLGGDKVSVRSLIVNPNVDPHAYEPTAADAIALAQARMAIVNGVGYDAWASRLLGADPSPSRTVLDVGTRLDLQAGENPHVWYSPRVVQRVIDWIVSDYQRLRPNDSRYFDLRRAAFEHTDLSAYRRLISRVRARYAGVPVGYSESIFQPLGEALGLKLLTPSSFAQAVAEGTEVTAADKQTVDMQAQRGLIKVWVYNSQNATPDVQRVTGLVRAAHIPVTTITETLTPSSDSFEQWQVAELLSLQNALHRATGR